MRKILTAFKLLFSKPSLFLVQILYYAGSDRLYIKYWFKEKMGFCPNLDNPTTFNEKLQWLKLYYRNPIQTKLVDKYAVKEYIKEKIGEQYIIPTLGVWDHFDEIDFDRLPNQFVLKCTHDSGGLVICRDKTSLDKKAAKTKIEKCLASDYYKAGREWPYKNVPRRIIAEKYMEDESGYELKDYKFFCFNGRCEYFKIDFDRLTEHHANYFSRDCQLMLFGEALCPPVYDRELSIPTSINEMIGLSEKVAADIGCPFVRIDFYNIRSKVFFGEITFFPAAGTGKFVPENWDTILGEKIVLPVHV